MRDYIIITLLMIAGFAGQANACSFGGDAVKAFSTSFTKETGDFYSLKTSKVDTAKWFLSGCSKSKKKFFQVSLGVSHDYIDNNTAITALHENFVPSACTLKPLPFKTRMSMQSEKEVFLEKLSFLNKCFDIYVTSLAKNKLIFPEGQIGCNPEYIKDHKVKLNGNLCYFDIIKGDGFLVELKFKEECKLRDFYKENKISTQDFMSHIGFNVMNSADGSGAGIITVGAGTIRMSIDPEPRAMRVSDDFGRANPLFPAVWSVPDVHFGKAHLISNGERSTLNLPFVADNRCKKVCVDGICSSPCNYSSPVAAEVELFEIAVDDFFDDNEDDFFGDDFKSIAKSLKKKPEFIKSFYNGGVVQANWQGQISGKTIDLGTEIKTGKRYRVKASFRDPKLDYHFLMKNYRSILGNIPSLREAEGGVIQGISTSGTDVLSSISEMLGNLATDTSTDSTGMSPLRRAVLKFQSLFSYHAWPVYVDKVCNDSLMLCKKPERKDNLVLTMDFTVGSKTGAMGEYELKDIKVSRKSPVIENYSKSMNLEDFPEIACYEEAEEESDAK